MLEDEEMSASVFHSNKGLTGDKSTVGFDLSVKVFGSTEIVSGSGELDPALPEVVVVVVVLPEVGGELVIAGIVATKACSAEITTLGGISLKIEMHQIATLGIRNLHQPGERHLGSIKHQLAKEVCGSNIWRRNAAAAASQ